MIYKRAEAVGPGQSSLVSCRERVFRIQKSEYTGRAPVNQSWSASRVAQSRVYSEAAVSREELQANGSCGIGRQATSEDTVRRLGKYYSELRSSKVYTL
jgi:hypothetical protein